MSSRKRKRALPMRLTDDEQHRFAWNMTDLIKADGFAMPSTSIPFDEISSSSGIEVEKLSDNIDYRFIPKRKRRFTRRSDSIIELKLQTCLPESWHCHIGTFKVNLEPEAKVSANIDNSIDKTPKSCTNLAEVKVTLDLENIIDNDLGNDFITHRSNNSQNELECSLPNSLRILSMKAFTTSVPQETLQAIENLQKKGMLALVIPSKTSIFDKSWDVQVCLSECALTKMKFASQDVMVRRTDRLVQDLMEFFFNGICNTGCNERIYMNEQMEFSCLYETVMKRKEEYGKMERKQTCTNTFIARNKPSNCCKLNDFYTSQHKINGKMSDNHNIQGRKKEFETNSVNANDEIVNDDSSKNIILDHKIESCEQYSFMKKEYEQTQAMEVLSSESSGPADSIASNSKVFCDYQHVNLKPTLRQYQSKAVQWMINKEKGSVLRDVSQDNDLHCLWRRCVTLDKKIIYFNPYNGRLTTEHFTSPVPPPGGILADEMGLGKTVEVIACILNNPKPANGVQTEQEDVNAESRDVSSLDNVPTKSEACLSSSLSTSTLSHPTKAGFEKNAMQESTSVLLTSSSLFGQVQPPSTSTLPCPTKTKSEEKTVQESTSVFKTSSSLYGQGLPSSAESLSTYTPLLQQVPSLPSSTELSTVSHLSSPAPVLPSTPSMRTILPASLASSTSLELYTQSALSTPSASSTTVTYTPPPFSTQSASLASSTPLSSSTLSTSSTPSSFSTPSASASSTPSLSLILSQSSTLSSICTPSAFSTPPLLSASLSSSTPSASSTLSFSTALASFTPTTASSTAVVCSSAAQSSTPAAASISLASCSALVTSSGSMLPLQLENSAPSLVKSSILNTSSIVPSSSLFKQKDGLITPMMISSSAPDLLFKPTGISNPQQLPESEENESPCIFLSKDMANCHPALPFNDTFHTSLTIDDNFHTSLPIDGNFHPALPINDNSHPALPIDDHSQSALPIDDNSHSALRIDDNSHSALPIDDNSHSALRIDDNSHSALPIDGNSHPALPIDGNSHPALPIDGNSHPALPIDGNSHSALPIDGNSHSALPIDGNSHSALPIDGNSHPALPIDGNSHPALPIDGNSHPALPIDDNSHPALPIDDNSHPALPIDDNSHPALPIDDNSHPALPIDDNSHPASPIDDNSQLELIKCVCGNIRSGFDDVLLKCIKCSAASHASCLGHSKADQQIDLFLCPTCAVNRPPIPSRATLIISPATIAHQWVEEITRHTTPSSLRLLEGVAKQGFVQPDMLADHDVILTTYATLRADFNHLGTQQGRSLRHQKRYIALPSPLTAIKFWRICLDEGQMVESTTAKAAEMALRLDCVHRWCVTGTPIQKGLEDLYGLLLFLGVFPYCQRVWWKRLLYEPYLRGNKEPMYDALADILWRTAKKNVLDEIQLPSQTELVVRLNFTPVEEHFYRRQHEECSASILTMLGRFGSSDIKLNSLDKNTVHRMLIPLLRLRQACCHPQAVRGGFLSMQKSTMTMDQLLEVLITRTKLECEEAHRQLLFSINGLAGIHTIKEEYPEAVELYRESMRSWMEHEDKFRTDALQKLHTLHNLSDLLSTDHPGCSRALRDDNLRKEAEELIEQYMAKPNTQVQAALDNLTAAEKNIEELLQKVCFQTPWWLLAADSIESSGLGQELIIRVKEDLSSVSTENTSIINSFTDLRGLTYTLTTKLDVVESTHSTLVQALEQLRTYPTPEMVHATAVCCLRSRPQKTSQATRCKFCEVDDIFTEYESRLFGHQGMKGVDDQEDARDTDWHRHGNTGGLRAETETEKVLKTLFGFIKSQRLVPSVHQDARNHLTFMETRRKEFKFLRGAWFALRERLSSLDELEMCTTKLRLAFPGENVNDDEKHVIQRGQVEQQKFKFISDRIIARTELRKKLGQYLYLTNLAKSKKFNEGENPDPCPVCTKQLGKEWSVFSCGHCYCCQCVWVLLRQAGIGPRNRDVHIKCPICRFPTLAREISYVCTGKDSNHDDKGVLVKGSHSTKVEAVVRVLLKIKTEDDTAKCLVFSTWQDVLELIGKALQENDVNFRHITCGGKRFQSDLHAFKEDPDVPVLLLPLQTGSNGLNIIEATHVLLVEPALNPAHELQAVGRVHRIGQTRPTFVHRFIINNTVESRMHSLLTGMSKAVVRTGSKDNENAALTIADLTSLFKEEEDRNQIQNYADHQDDIEMIV